MDSQIFGREYSEREGVAEDKHFLENGCHRRTCTNSKHHYRKNGIYMYISYWPHTWVFPGHYVTSFPSPLSLPWWIQEYRAMIWGFHPPTANCIASWTLPSFNLWQLCWVVFPINGLSIGIARNVEGETQKKHGKSFKSWFHLNTSWSTGSILASATLVLLFYFYSHISCTEYKYIIYSILYYLYSLDTVGLNFVTLRLGSLCQK